MKNRVVVCVLIGLLAFVSAFQAGQGYEIAAKIARELVAMRWDIETARSTAKAVMTYGQDYRKHLSSVKLATQKLARELKIPASAKDLLNKIRVELLAKVNKMVDQADHVMDKKLAKQSKELNSISSERQSLRRQMRDDEDAKSKSTKQMVDLARRTYELKTRVLKTLRALLELKYQVLNLEFADSVEKYSREYKKFLVARDKQKKTVKKTVAKNGLTIVKKPQTERSVAKVVLPAQSQGYKNYKLDNIDWAQKLTRELDKELNQTSLELAQMSDRLTKELADLERMGIELFGAHQSFVA